jgi:hypothetical protein
MSKPLFFTGRKEISRGHVTVKLIERQGEATRFKASVGLTRYRLPNDAQVMIEAYHNAYLERFPCGTVGATELDQERTLERLEPGDRPLFRVKVIATAGAVSGRLLAAIDEVRPETEGDEGAAGSLLPIVPKTREWMGDEFWKVRFVAAGDEKKPELWVNCDVPGLFAMIQNQDPRVTSLILPEVLRQVLRGLFEDGENWTDEGRLGQWLSLAGDFHPDKFEEWDEGEDDEPQRERRRDWVDQVVKGFARKHRFFDRYQEQLGAAGGEAATDD